MNRFVAGAVLVFAATCAASVYFNLRLDVDPLILLFQMGVVLVAVPSVTCASTAVVINRLRPRRMFDDAGRGWLPGVAVGILALFLMSAITPLVQAYAELIASKVGLIEPYDRYRPWWFAYHVEATDAVINASCAFVATAIIVLIMRRRQKPGHCIKCGYDVRASIAFGRCPECGAGI